MGGEECIWRTNESCEWDGVIRVVWFFRLHGLSLVIVRAIGWSVLLSDDEARK